LVQYRELAEGFILSSAVHSTSPLPLPTVSAAAEHDALRRAGAPDEEPGYFGLSLTAWLKIAVITALLVVTYWPNLRRLALKVTPYIGEPNWGHSLFIPIIGLYYLYLNRDELLRARVQPILPGRFSKSLALITIPLIAVGGIIFQLAGRIAPTSVVSFVAAAGAAVAAWAALSLLLNWGLGTLLFGLLLSAYGIFPGRNDFVWDFGMVVVIFGVVLLLCGWDVMKIAWFPIAFLVCALPWPGLVYSKVATPLQQLAATVAVGTLQLTGVDAARVGSKIFIENGFGLPTRTLNVAEACAGMRSLMTFISVAGAIAFLSSRPLWQKIVISLSAIPIAIFCNVMRVAGQGLLDHYVSQQLSESFAHQFVGMVMLVPAFFLILLVGWVLDQIFIEEVEASPATVAAARAAHADKIVRVRRPPQTSRQPQTTGTPGTSEGGA
jgi:exosortase